VRTKEQKEEEHRMRGMLISALSEDQFYRFENWRAANLSKASVRRVRTCPLSLLAYQTCANPRLACQRDYFPVRGRKRRNRNARRGQGLHR
jgi:hypothetical protein